MLFADQKPHLLNWWHS